MKITWEKEQKKIKIPPPQKLPKLPKPTKLFNTSTELNVSELTDTSVTTFLVQQVYTDNNSKVILSRGCKVVLSGQWSELRVEIGDSFSVVECPCCINEVILNPIQVNESQSNDKSIINRENESNTFIINDKSNFLFLLNDTLINVTLIAESFDCINKAFFRSKVLQLQREPLDIHLVIGRIIHELIEKYFTLKKEKKRDIKEIFNTSNKDNISDLNNTSNKDNINIINIKDNTSNKEIFNINSSKNIKDNTNISNTSKNNISNINNVSNINSSKNNNIIKLLEEIIKENHSLIKKSKTTENSLLSLCLPHLTNLLPYFTQLNGTPELFFSSIKYGIKGRVDLFSDSVYEFKSTNLHFKHQIQSLLYSVLTNRPVKLISSKNGTLFSVKMNHQMIKDTFILRNKVISQQKRFSYISCTKCTDCINYSQLGKCLNKLFEMVKKEEEENQRVKVYFKKQDLIYNPSKDIINKEGYSKERSNNPTLIRRVFFCSNIPLEKIYYKVFFNNTFITKCKVMDDYLLCSDQIDFSDFIYFFLEEDCDIFYLVYRFSVLQGNELIKLFDEEKIYERIIDDSFSDKNIITDEKNNNLDYKNNSIRDKENIININTENKIINTDINDTTKENNINKSIENINDKSNINKSNINEEENEIINSSFFNIKNLNISLQIPSFLTKEFLKFNSFQRKTILSSINLTNKFYLVHGLPGTGKSKCIKFIITLLAHYKKKVLVMTYTNRSLLLLNSVISEYITYINCFGYNDSIFNDSFDWLVVDESTQMHFPLCFVGMKNSERVVLFGDDKQLSPICKVRGLGLSVFELVKKFLKINPKIGERSTEINESDKNELMSDYLRITYRMSKKVTHLANILFYNHKLIPHSSKPGTLSYYNTSDLSEILLLYKDSVILCYYNNTVSKLKSVYSLSQGQCCTIDKFQGSESENIILFVDKISELCFSKERINVAVTRSRNAFCVVGLRSVISECNVICEVVDLIEKINNEEIFE